VCTKGKDCAKNDFDFLLSSLPAISHVSIEIVVVVHVVPFVVLVVKCVS
jgi:hypothetical protein